MASSSASKFSAADSFIGYIYQCEYALYRLLDRDKPAAQVSIETLDDVVEGDIKDPEALLQLKHHSGDKKSFTDKSPDLWKTLRVWSEQIKGGHVDPSSTGFFLLTTATASSSATLAEHLAADEVKSRDAVAALGALVSIATEAANVDKPNPKNDVYKGATAFLSLDDHQRVNLVRNIRIITEVPPINGLRKKILQRLSLSGALESELDEFAHAVVGWWYWSVIATMTTGAGKTISREALELRIKEVSEMLSASSLPVYIDLDNPSDEDLANLSERLFVRQLALLGLSDGNAMYKAALVDFYKADGHIKRWAEQLRLSPEELAAYENDLHSIWSTLFGLSELKVSSCEQEASPAEALRQLGSTVLADTLTAAGPKLKKFEGDYIRRGTFHLMANYPKIGWHPYWQKHLDNGGGSK